VYLFMLSQLGIIGSVCVIGVFVHSIFRMIRLESTSGLRWCGLGLAFAFTCLLCGGITDDSSLFGTHTSYLAWMLLGVSEAISRITSNELRSQEVVI
jgi:hypothetical protein